MSDKTTATQVLLASAAALATAVAFWLQQKRQAERLELIRLRTELAKPVEQRVEASNQKPAEIFLSGESVVYLKPSHLSEVFGERTEESPLKQAGVSGARQGVDLRFVEEDARMLESVWRNGTTDKQFRQFQRSGPRGRIYWRPSTVRAAIITCGGLCPGLNNVIRGLTQMLTVYGVEEIWGVKEGYLGICNAKCWVRLSMQMVQEIHQHGGSFLVANRGNDDPQKMAAELMRRGVNQLYVIGGDGSHRGAAAVHRELQKAGYECGVVGVPKTIDRDIPIIDESFGFSSAVAEATNAIKAAYVEASGCPNGIGLVKLMGRHSGFVVMYAVLAAGVVDVALIPEMEEVCLDKVLQHMESVVKTKGRCVLVVAEGCGKTLMQVDETKRDAGGNMKLPDVGMYLREKITEYSKSNKLDWSMKFIDPTYMIRAVPANSADAVYCHVLAHNAVHSAMAGYTGVSIGRVDQHYVMIPIDTLTSLPPRQVNIAGRYFSRLLMTTCQPSFSPQGKVVRKSSFLL